MRIILAISTSGLNTSPKLRAYIPCLSTRSSTAAMCLFLRSASSLDAFSPYRLRRSCPAMPGRTTGTPVASGGCSFRTNPPFPSGTNTPVRYRPNCLTHMIQRLFHHLRLAGEATGVLTAFYAALGALLSKVPARAGTASVSTGVKQYFAETNSEQQQMSVFSCWSSSTLQIRRQVCMLQRSLRETLIEACLGLQVPERLAAS